MYIFTLILHLSRIFNVTPFKIIYEKNSNLRNNRFRCEYIKCKCFKL